MGQADVRDWKEKLAVRQHALRRKGQRDHLQRDRDGEREWTKSVPIPDVSVRAASAVNGSERSRGTGQAATLVTVAAADMPHVYNLIQCIEALI